MRHGVIEGGHAELEQERRLQIRRAQRTYRQKKEATITALKTRVEALEQTLQTVSELLDPVGDKASVDRARRLVLAEIDQTRPCAGVGQSHSPDQHADTLHDVFGYHVSLDADQRLDLQHQHRSLPPPPRPRSPTPLLNRLFPTNTIYTYSYQESSLSRRLQRFCLEHVYRWLSDPHTDPHLMIRVFGLLPCIHDMPGVRRAFRRVLQSEIGSSLEGSKLPFYTLGGAGQHYPRTDQDGRPVYPEKMRRPGKILRRLARILRRGSIQDWDEDWSGDAEPRMDEFHDMDKAMSDEDRLRSLDLDGDWFDCHDVQGYLEHRGVVLNGSSLWLEVPGETVGTLHGLSPDQSASELYGSSEEISPGETSLSQYMGQSKYTLNVENFFECEYRTWIDILRYADTSIVLLANLRILGRAPGFRLWDVDAALRTSIHRRPFS